MSWLKKDFTFNEANNKLVFLYVHALFLQDRSLDSSLSSSSIILGRSSGSSNIQISPIDLSLLLTNAIIVTVFVVFLKAPPLA